MKTLKKGKDILRLSDKEAEKMVKEEGWSYCPKSEYKKVRDSRNVGPAGKKGAKGKGGRKPKPKS